MSTPRVPELRSCKHTPAQGGRTHATGMASVDISDFTLGTRNLDVLALCPACREALERFMAELAPAIKG